MTEATLYDWPLSRISKRIFETRTGWQNIYSVISLVRLLLSNQNDLKTAIEKFHAQNVCFEICPRMLS